MRAPIRLAAALSVSALPLLAQDGTPAGQSNVLDPVDALDAVATAVVEKASRAVVVVEVERNVPAPRQLTFRERQELGVGGGYDPRYFSRPEGPASGVVVGKDQVATSCWNVEGDGAVTVITADGRRIAAQRLGRDENLDLTLLSAPGLGVEPLKTAPTPSVGRFVFLIARSPDLSISTTQGIVSGLGRYSGDAFAHSARTSYEHAGGALVDLEGRLVGIASRHGDRVRQGQSSGVGFGAPVTKLTDALPALARGEVVPRRQIPFMGIEPDLDATVVGVKLRRVQPGSAADKAGIKAGDVIKIFNQVEIKSFGQLREEIRSLAVGQSIGVTVERGSEQLDLKVELGGRVEQE